MRILSQKASRRRLSYIRNIVQVFGGDSRPNRKSWLNFSVSVSFFVGTWHLKKSLPNSFSGLNNLSASLGSVSKLLHMVVKPNICFRTLGGFCGENLLPIFLLFDGIEVWNSCVKGSVLGRVRLGITNQHWLFNSSMVPNSNFDNIKMPQFLLILKLESEFSNWVKQGS